MVQSTVTGGDLFADLPNAAPDEQFESLLSRPGIRILRIVSNGQASPEGEWYDQAGDEWVVVLRGSAGVLIEGETEARELGPGAFLFLPAHSRHRVAWTSADEPTVWLAVHIEPPNE
jgi:cupin 2 domain-containing protein